MASKQKSWADKIDSYRPKPPIKYKFILTNDDLIEELDNAKYDINSLDIINNNELINHALSITNKKTYPKDVIKTKHPYELDCGIVLSKNLIPKADKQLNSIDVGAFQYNDYTYLSISFVYELFTILEIFVLV